MISVILLTVACVLGLLFVSKCIKPKEYPPGPRWLPLVGCSRLVSRMYQQHGSQWKAMLELAKEYSTQILGLKLGDELVVVVYGEKNIRHVLSNEEFEGRPNSYFMKLRCLGKRIGITGTDGPLWREHRQFTIKHLKHVGFGKPVMEEDIQKELENIIEYLQKNSKNVAPKNILAPAVLNVLWKFTAGETLKDNQRVKELLRLLNDRSRAFTMSGGWLNQFPWIRFIFPESSGYSLICKINKDLSELIENAIAKHKNSSVKGDDFIYSFLKEINAGKKTYTEEQLKVICLDLLIAGSQTTSNTLEFALLVLLRDQVIQDQVYEEVRSTLGSKTPSWADSKRMPFTSSFLLEVHRYFSIVPLIGPRRTLKNTKLDNYIIPKDSTILISARDHYFNPEIWTEPDKFKPERFLSKNGFNQTEHLFHFGFGRRRCPGDALAKTFSFIFFVGIVQSFKIKCANGVVPCWAPIIGLVNSPKQYVADFILRKGQLE